MMPRTSSLGGQVFSYTPTLRNTGSSTRLPHRQPDGCAPNDVQYHVDDKYYTRWRNWRTPRTSGGVVAGFGGTLTFPNVADVAPGDTVTIVYLAKLQPAPSVGTVETNTATIASYGSQPTGVVVNATFRRSTHPAV